MGVSQVAGLRPDIIVYSVPALLSDSWICGSMGSVIKIVMHHVPVHQLWLLCHLGIMLMRLEGPKPEEASE